MPSRNQRDRWLLAAAMTGCAGSALCGASLWWAWPRTSSEQFTPGPAAPASNAKTNALTGDPALWERLSFRAPQPIAPVANDKPTREIRLVGIFPRRGKTVAAIEIAKGSPLAFLAVGESRDGVKVLAIDGKRVSVDVDGTSRRLGDQP